MKYDLGLYNKLIESLEENASLLNNPAIATYYAASLMISHDTRNYFDSYYQLLEKNHAIFAKEEKFMFYILATNFLGRNPTVENTIESFVIYQRQVELGLYDEKIPHYAFKNIIGAGLISKAYDWIEQFIEDYGPKLAKEHQLPMINLAQSALDWRQGQYEKALKSLELTKFKDPYLNIAARQTTTKILYELKDWETLRNHLKAFEVFVRRVKDAGHDKSIYLEFVLFAQKVFRLKPYDKKEKSKLIHTLENNSTILDREWLLKCLNNI